MLFRTLGALAALLLAGCGANNVVGQVDGGGGTGAGGAPGPRCMSVAASENTCSGGADDDCDGFVDCLDTDCDGQRCGDGLTCSGGACRKPCAAGAANCVPELPVIQNVKVTTRADTVTIDFEPVAGARRLPHLSRARGRGLADRRRRRGGRQERHLPLRRRSRVPRPQGRPGRALRLLDHRRATTPATATRAPRPSRPWATSSSPRPPTACPCTAWPTRTGAAAS